MAYEKTGQFPHINSEINVPRLLDDLEITATDMRRLAGLDIPTDIRVPSVSPIKTSTVADALRIVQPGREFSILGVKAPSDIDEQPLGQTTIDGSLNRLRNGIAAREQVAPGEAGRVAWFSIENGLFRVATPVSDTLSAKSREADLTSTFDPNAEYEDRAVTAIRIPGFPTLIEISPASEAVLFPHAAVLAAHNAEGGFEQHTAGSKLAEMGMVRDKQNPHRELTANRLGGPLARQDQMARVIIRSLVGLVRE